MSIEISRRNFLKTAAASLILAGGGGGGVAGRDSSRDRPFMPGRPDHPKII